MDSADDTLAGGLPHSEIPGSRPARGSPELIAACYVLHRLSVPRHPPDALSTLDPHLVRHAQEPTHRAGYWRYARQRCFTRPKGVTTTHGSPPVARRSDERTHDGGTPSRCWFGTGPDDLQPVREPVVIPSDQPRSQTLFTMFKIPFRRVGRNIPRSNPQVRGAGG